MFICGSTGRDARSRAFRLLFILALILTLGLLPRAAARAAEADPPTHRLAVIETEHLTVYVPAVYADELRELSARADRIYTFLSAESGVTTRYRPVVWFADDVDYLNGWASPLPRPVVQSNLTAAPPNSGIFFGESYVDRVLIHEFAHHFSNELNYGLRGAFERIFGRVLPNDLYSALVWYVSTPAHITMPAFWHEGIAQWAETVYADPENPWAGRGRSSLTHMVWRLHAAAGRLPPAADWRLTYHEWPYGNQAYLYGLAYTRYLAAAYGHVADIWKLVEWQAARGPFEFDAGLVPVLGRTHGRLIGEAREALLAEQEGVIQEIRKQPLTECARLTPEGFYLGAPAWTGDGRLFACARDPHGRARCVVVDEFGNVDTTRHPAHALSPARRSPRGAIVYASYRSTRRNNLRRRVHIIEPDGRRRSFGMRLMQPDLDDAGPSRRLAAIHLVGAGRQELALFEDGFQARRTVPARGRPWSPAFRPGGGSDVAARELAWVETDDRGSRLVLAPLAHLEDPERRRILAELKARILHPCWSPDGSKLYYCSDVSGVANAYCLEVTDGRGPLSPRPVTNTIGGVLACVSSPDGKELALLDHDEGGPFLARVPNDPSLWPAQVPRIELAWPAPVGRRDLPRHVATAAGVGEKEEAPPDIAAAPSSIRAPLRSFGASEGAVLRSLGEGGRALPGFDPDAAKGLEVRPYRGLSQAEFLFWTPTTLVVPEGGTGVVAYLADPTMTNQLLVGYGEGPRWGERVGQAQYLFTGWPRLDLAMEFRQSEVTFGGQVVSDVGDRFHYAERRSVSSVRLGANLSGIERHGFAYVGGGVSDATAVEEAAALYDGLTLVSPEPFAGREHFVEVGLGYDSTTFFPTSFSVEDGLGFSLRLRHSGLGGDLERNRAVCDASWTWSVAPRRGHQIVLRGAAGWSDGDPTLQGTFVIGGAAGIPRGYPNTMSVGPHFVSYSAAYRLPLVRPFRGLGTTPVALRQIFAELFYDDGRILEELPVGGGGWFGSAGLKLGLNVSFWTAQFSPGILVARQLDGDEAAYFAITLDLLF